MKLIKLKKADLELSPIIFGAWAIGGWMWGGAEEKDALAALKASYDLGVTSIDTAAVYGFGQSEELVGKAFKGMREKVQILTKFGLNWTQKKGAYYFSSEDNNGKALNIYYNASRDNVIRECEDSLKRLGTDYIDLYQLHWPDPSTPLDETMEALNILLEQGKIRAAGVSNFDADLLDSALKTTLIVSDQVPYSMLNRNIESELVPYCIENDIDILAYSPLQRGILTGKFNPDHHFNKGDNRSELPWYGRENILKINSFLTKIKKIADSKNASLTQLVLKWTLLQPGITYVLAGARNPGQITENAAAAQLELFDDEIAYINKQISELDLRL